jgi:hypothetical protein
MQALVYHRFHEKPKPVYELPEGWSVYTYGNEPVHVVVMSPEGDVITYTVEGSDLVLRVAVLDDEPWEHESTDWHIADFICTHIGLELTESIRMDAYRQRRATCLA